MGIWDSVRQAWQNQVLEYRASEGRLEPVLSVIAPYLGLRSMYLSVTCGVNVDCGVGWI